METRQKNILIGGLLAIILVMAVGYAAFATRLNINGTATIDSTWNVHFDQSRESGTGIVDATPGLTGATAPSGGAITYENSGLTAKFAATLNQPGDTVTYTLWILNEGSFAALAEDPVLTITDKIGSATGDVDGLTATLGHVRYTVTKPEYATNNYTIPAKNGSTVSHAVMTVTAEFIDTDEATAAHCSDSTYQTQEACETAGQSDETIKWIPATSGETGNMTTAEEVELTVTINYVQA